MGDRIVTDEGQLRQVGLPQWTSDELHPQVATILAHCPGDQEVASRTRNDDDPLGLVGVPALDRRSTSIDAAGAVTMARRRHRLAALAPPLFGFWRALNRLQGGHGLEHTSESVDSRSIDAGGLADER